MLTRRLRLTYPLNLVDEPIVYELIKQFSLVTSIRQADRNAEGGWLVLDVRGEEEQIAQALDWLHKLGIGVEEVPSE